MVRADRGGFSIMSNFDVSSFQPGETSTTKFHDRLLRYVATNKVPSRRTPHAQRKEALALKLAALNRKAERYTTFCSSARCSEN